MASSVNLKLGTCITCAKVMIVSAYLCAVGSQKRAHCGLCPILKLCLHFLKHTILCACARGKVPGSVVVIVVIDTQVAKSRDLGT